MQKKEFLPTRPKPIKSTCKTQDKSKEVVETSAKKSSPLHIWMNLVFFFHFCFYPSSVLLAMPIHFHISGDYIFFWFFVLIYSTKMTSFRLVSRRCRLGCVRGRSTTVVLCWSVCSLSLHRRCSIWMTINSVVYGGLFPIVVVFCARLCVVVRIVAGHKSDLISAAAYKCTLIEWQQYVFCLVISAAFL